jgi:DNA-binding transcriptional ArsR family regulator
LESSELDLSFAKLEVLETLFLHDEPVKAAQIAKETGKDQRAVQMHLIGLVRMDWAEAPKKGQYLITENGKKALGLPEVTKEKALTILTQIPMERAFHFYDGVGKPLNVYAWDLLDFCDKIDKVSVESVEFHFKRGDFETWFRFLGDEELSKKMELLKRKKAVSEELRGKIRQVTENRCLLLTRRTGQTSLPP